jgi:hypothetical protein
LTVQKSAAANKIIAMKANMSLPKNRFRNKKLYVKALKFIVNRISYLKIEAPLNKI